MARNTNKNLIIGSVYNIGGQDDRLYGPYLYLGENYKRGAHEMLESDGKICYWDFEDIFVCKVFFVV